eukprot:Hpha_TRINITY_DN4626_c0_g1::TRINITY_DN4626_c0_g1_i1::g.97023::m.97023
MVSFSKDDALAVLMYFGGPFFCYPYKPILQGVYGRAGYDRAYEHFARDHNLPLNLGLHTLALVWQAVSNFAFLHRLEELFPALAGGGRPSLSQVTAALWCGILSQQPAPVAARLAAVAAVIGAYLVRGKSAGAWSKLISVAGVVESFGIVNFVAPGAPLPVVALIRGGLQYFIDRPKFRGAAAGWKSTIVAILYPILLQLSYRPMQRRPNVFMYALIGWIISTVTGESAFFLHSCAFTASLFQGISHQLSGEKATLMQLTDAHDEWAHTTYFPLLLTHRLWDTLFS